jgi:hypothetical protein
MWRIARIFPDKAFAIGQIASAMIGSHWWFGFRELFK